MVPRQIPKGEAGVVAIFIENLLSGRPSVIYHFPDEPDGMARDYCYVEDVVKANILVLKNGSNEIFNIGFGKPTRTRELYKRLYDLVNNSNPSLRSPVPAPPRPGDIKRSCLNIDKAKRMLGWTPDVSLEEGLKKTVGWYSTHKV
ncbi:MAG: UDP-glucose 4-epimerase [Candidatus Methanoperedenaceae archaeon GB37]|nr:MAG: UDP-glucose 4-epimerase [Candidatus Methanoperedenaceae archaeon GB37]